MRNLIGVALPLAAFTLIACNGPERTYDLPPAPALAEPTVPDPVQSDTLNRQVPVYMPSPSPSWTLMPSQRTSCGRNFC